MWAAWRCGRRARGGGAAARLPSAAGAGLPAPSLGSPSPLGVARPVGSGPVTVGAAPSPLGAGTPSGEPGQGAPELSAGQYGVGGLPVGCQEPCGPAGVPPIAPKTSRRCPSPGRRTRGYRRHWAPDQEQKADQGEQRQGVALEVDGGVAVRQADVVGRRDDDHQVGADPVDAFGA